jgi:hypothetical protein
MVEGRGGKERCSFRTRTRASKSVGGMKTVFLFKNVQESNEFFLRGIKNYGFSHKFEV